jgi:hypothetical protein
MAKKARKKLEEDAEPAFEFPPFDEAGFLWKEYELGTATMFAAAMALLLGIVGWALSAAGLIWPITLAIGFAGVAGGAFVIQRLRPYSYYYTKGDWAGLLALEFFGWFAIWFLLLNISPTL